MERRGAFPNFSRLCQLFVESANGFQENRLGLGDVALRDRVEVSLGLLAGSRKRSLRN